MTSCVGGRQADYSVGGRVEDPAGAGIAGVELLFSRGQATLGVAGPTGADGRWRKDGLSGVVTVKPFKDGWLWSPDQKEVARAGEYLVFVGTKLKHALTLEVSGQGRIDSEIAAAVQRDYEHGTEVRLTAVADQGWRFSHWEGDLQGRSNPAVLVMDSPKKVGAVFKPEIFLSGKIELRHQFPYSVLQGASLGVPPPAQPDWSGSEEQGLIVIFDPCKTFSQQRQELEQRGYLVLDSIRLLNAHLVKPKENLAAAARQAGEMEGVLFAEPNKPMFPWGLVTPNDPRYEQQWHYKQIRLPQAWATTTGDRSVRIAVIDTGADLEHPDLKGQLDLVNCYNFADNNKNVRDYDGHGTHVAGTIGAATNNSTGVAGVIWEVEILPIKVFRSGGFATSWDVALGILYGSGLLVEAGKPYNPRPADILNLSLGGSHSQVMEEAVRAASGAGLLIVAAAGNNNGPVIYPAAYEEVIAVGAVGLGRDSPPPRAGYSNFGPELDVVAPGGFASDYILSTTPGGTYGFYSGTSMAAPHVSGVLGLMLAAGLPRSELREILHRTCLEIGGPGFSDYYGQGLVNAYWAVNGVDRIRVIVGRREGRSVEVFSETALGPKGGEFSLLLPLSGEYRLIAWVDVTGNNRIDPGDYYGESPPFTVDYSRSYDDWYLQIEEVAENWPE